MIYSILVPGRPAPAIDRRNFRLGVLNGLFFTTAETLINPGLVLVAFVGALTQSPLLIGLVSPLRDGGWYLPQLWVSGYLQSRPLKLELYRRAAIVRIIAWAAMALAVLLVRDPGWLLASFFAAFTVYSLASGFAGLPFLEIVGKTVPPQRRTSFFAWRLTTGGLTAIIASSIVRWALSSSSPFGFMESIGFLMGAGWLLAIFGLISFGLVIEPPDESVRPAARIGSQLSRAWGVLRSDPNYRRYIEMRAVTLIGGAAVPFYAVYVRRDLAGSVEMVGVYLAAYTLAHLAANALIGRFGSRLGKRRTLWIGAAAGLVMALAVAALVVTAWMTPVSGAVAGAWLVPAFVLSGIRESGMGVAANAYLLDIAPPGDRSLYLGFTNSLLGLVQLSTSLGGVVVAMLGFPALVAISVAAYALGLVGAARLLEAAGDKA